MKPMTRIVTALFGAVTVAAGLLLAGAAALAAPQEPADELAATVTLSHFAPFTTTITGTAVTVRINGNEIMTNVVFGQSVPDVALPAGAQTLELIPSGGGAPILTATLNLSEGVDYSVAAIGGANSYPLEVYTLVNDTTPLAASAKVRVTHLAPFAPPFIPGLTAVDVCTKDGAPVPGLTGLTYKTTTGYLPLAPGIYDLKVVGAGTNCVGGVDLPLFALSAGQIVDAFAIGLFQPSDPALQLTVSQRGLAPRARFAHFAPFAGPISTTITWKVDGNELPLPAFFPQLTLYNPLPLGDHFVEAVHNGTTVISGTAVISGWLDYTFAAIGDGVNQPLELLRMVDDNATPPPAGMARLQLAHFAPIANNVDGTKVDVCVSAGDAPLVDNMAYKQVAVINLPVGLHRVFLAAPESDCDTPLVNVPPFIVGEGQIAYAYAVGDMVNIPPPTVITVPDLTPRWLYLPLVSTE